MEIEIAGPIYGGGTSAVLVSFGSLSEVLSLTALSVQSFSFAATVGAGGSVLRIADAGTSFGNNNIGSTLFAVSITPDAGGGGGFAAVPGPAALGLFGLALAGLVATRRRG